MIVVPAPSSLDERQFDSLVKGLGEESDERVLVDARHTRWVDPFGMIGLLALGHVAARRGEKPLLQLPDDHDPVSYLARMNFFEQAEEVFEITGPARRKRTEQAGSSDVLLEVTPIRSYDDVHDVVERVNERGMTILTSQLHYPRAQAVQFTAMLSEVCQNIVDHAEGPGWVATQSYTWQKRLGGRRVVVIAVMDLGVGFRGSLASAHASRFVDRWNDAMALEQAFMHGLNRFHDPHRGQGLQQIRKNAGRWGGRVSIRSGTARINEVPDWDDSPPLEDDLPYFPGSQIGIILPARVDTPTEPASSREGARR
jgi:anti-sigma regulatory factor (Ser/Thr protein kinase)